MIADYYTSRVKVMRFSESGGSNRLPDYEDIPNVETRFRFYDVVRIELVW